MRPVDRIILGLVVLAVATAAFFAVRRRKRGGSCCGDCCSCAQNAPCKDRQKKADK